MTVHLPTIKQLQYLVALRQHGHFGKAADACYVTQSTLSAGLRELETSARRGAGRAHSPGGSLHRAWRKGRRPARCACCVRRRGWPRWLGPRDGRCMASFASGSSRPSRRSFSRRCCRGLRKQWPSLKLYLREETSQAACEALHRGQLDCVLLALPFACGEVEARAAVRRSTVRRLSARRSAGGRRSRGCAIDENRLLLLEDGHCLKDHALSACNRPELRAQPR